MVWSGRLRARAMGRLLLAFGGGQCRFVTAGSSSLCRDQGCPVAACPCYRRPTRCLGATTSPKTTTTTTSTTTTAAAVAPYTTVEPKSAENVIESNTGKFGSIQAKSVSCPSGVQKVDGAKFDSQVTLVNTSTGAQASGTITLHLTNGGTQATFSGSDINVK